MLTFQGVWVTQDAVQGLSRDLLKGLIGGGQERELAITFEEAVEPGRSHGSLWGRERMEHSLKALGFSADKGHTASPILPQRAQALVEAQDEKTS